MTLATENTVLRARLDKARTCYRDQQKQIAELRQEVCNLQGKLASDLQRHHEDAHLYSRIAFLATDVERLQTSRANMEVSRDSWRTKAQALRLNNDALRTKGSLLEIKLLHKEQEIRFLE